MKAVILTLVILIYAFPAIAFDSYTVEVLKERVSQIEHNGDISSFRSINRRLDKKKPKNPKGGFGTDSTCPICPTQPSCPQQNCPTCPSASCPGLEDSVSKLANRYRIQGNFYQNQTDNFTFQVTSRDIASATFGYSVNHSPSGTQYNSGFGLSAYDTFHFMLPVEHTVPGTQLVGLDTWDCAGFFVNGNTNQIGGLCIIAGFDQSGSIGPIVIEFNGTSF